MTNKTIPFTFNAEPESPATSPSTSPFSKLSPIDQALLKRDIYLNTDLAKAVQICFQFGMVTDALKMSQRLAVQSTLIKLEGRQDYWNYHKAYVVQEIHLTDRYSYLETDPKLLREKIQLFK